MSVPRSVYIACLTAAAVMVAAVSIPPKAEPIYHPSPPYLLSVAEIEEREQGAAMLGGAVVPVALKGVGHAGTRPD